jgi:hypothetical protein
MLPAGRCVHGRRGRDRHREMHPPGQVPPINSAVHVNGHTSTAIAGESNRCAQLCVTDLSTITADRRGPQVMASAAAAEPGEECL